MAKTPQKKNQTIAGYAPRHLAANWLFEVINRQRPLDDVLLAAEQDPVWQALSGRDRGFARALIMEALRRKGDVDWVLGHFLKKPPPRKSRVWEILSIGAVQMLFLEGPPHAAIDQAVRQAKASTKSQHLAKLVNAVLRKVSEQGQELLAATPAARNIPQIFLDRWRQTLWRSRRRRRSRRSAGRRSDRPR